MSLQMGGYDKYINVGVTDISGDKNKGKIVDRYRILDTITEYDQDKFKKDLDELNKRKLLNNEIWQHQKL